MIARADCFVLLVVLQREKGVMEAFVERAAAAHRVRRCVTAEASEGNSLPMPVDMLLPSSSRSFRILSTRLHQDVMTGTAGFAAARGGLCGRRL